METLSESHIDRALANAVDTALAPAPAIRSTQNASRPPAFWRNVTIFLTDVYLCKHLILASSQDSLMNCFLAYIFWTLFTSLIPTLFYFSVWKLGIAGHELALLSVLSPFLLSLSSPYNYIFTTPGVNQTTLTPSVLAFARTRRGQVILRLTSLIGVVAYLVPSPGGRLGLVAVANVVAVMRQVVAWSGIVDGENDVAYQAISMCKMLKWLCNGCRLLAFNPVTGLGVSTSSLLKQANRANNPGNFIS